MMAVKRVKITAIFGVLVLLQNHNHLVGNVLQKDGSEWYLQLKKD